MHDVFPGPERRNYSTYAEAARANPGKWIELPWKDDAKSNLVTHYRKHYGIEGRRFAGVTYIRASK